MPQDLGQATEHTLPLPECEEHFLLNENKSEYLTLCVLPHLIPMGPLATGQSKIHSIKKRFQLLGIL